ncbi:uncharacterized protein BDR25DRAFT_305734 [Lindgomyces ingoldianus]|uniref:Uncharacterized protein n=1 Tax=Lindgomyces ingoldianus TaxID=673940 RepID=A0ACB6QM17_9PLEO|nr:uncharacterized protein BDR25DRAFT_305734 [Lindgomyces ingoldianus]KAF2467352.1 hypothetical protein BDR25DRAFT_305734 [Lindgomyces ingoldianus]
MPAPLAKGSGRTHSPSPHSRPIPRPAHPFQTGLIIVASVVVAAGIAIYESPQVRAWLDQSRRKIAVALHSLGDEIQPRRPSEASDDYEARKRKRDELMRRNKNELIRRAREEGIAVDLDELARIGREEVEVAEMRQLHRQRPRSNRSFDDLVGSDGMLKTDTAAGTATGAESADNGLRKRGVAGFDAGAAAANPFTDDNAQILLDQDNDDDDDEAPSPKPFQYIESRESSVTIQGDIPASSTTGQLIDFSPDSPRLGPENPQTASIPPSEVGDHDYDHTYDQAQSFYSFASSSSMQNSTHSHVLIPADDDSDAEHLSTGTLTPRSEHSIFTGASVGSHADDIAVLSLQNDDDHDARSEAFSDGGFTDAAVSEAGFSEVSGGDERRLGVMTPSSWTDVGSDDESEWGGPAQGGQVHQ